MDSFSLTNFDQVEEGKGCKDPEKVKAFIEHPSMPKVLVAGDANVDLIVPFPRFLNDRRTLVEYPNPCLVGGGTCANTAVALSRLGVGTGFAGTIGCDQYGAYIKKDFEKEALTRPA